MFGNFIYFIIALLVYTTYQPPENPNFPPIESFFLFILISGLFWAITRLQFQRIKRMILGNDHLTASLRFDSVVTRQSILAVAVFAFDIYALGLPAIVADLPVLRSIPTLHALVFIGLFTGYLAIIWATAHETHLLLFASGMSRKEYVRSNILFAVPVLLPWLAISAISDLLNALPFESLHRLLNSTAGEIAYFLIFLVIAAVVAPALIQKFWQCSPLEPGYHRSRIEALCKEAGLKYNNILRWSMFGGRMITAGVMGLVGRFRYILVTDALLRYLTPEEIDSVIAHEIGHVKKKHLLFYLLFLMGYMLISYALFDLIIFFILYTRPLFQLIGSLGIDQTTATSIAFSVAIIALFLIYFRFVFGFFMRNFERQADAYVFQLFPTALPLISTLKKIASTSRQDADKPNWHHFSITERVDFLYKCENDRRWIVAHDRKIRRSMAAFFAALAIAGTVGYHLNFGDAGSRLNSRFLETLVLRELEKSPDDSKLLATLGDLYYNRNNYEETIGAYTAALDIDPHMPQVLNNLAWLYATCEEKRFRNPQMALKLAISASELDKSAHILDTLAESYYVNGYFTEAVIAAERALQAATSDRKYFQEQLQKFKTARETGSLE